MTPPTYAPGDRVVVAGYGVSGTFTRRHATVEAGSNAVGYTVQYASGEYATVHAAALRPLPPATRKRSKPGQGRPASRWLLHTGDVFAVCLAAATGEATPLVGYTVTEIDAAAGRIVWTAASGERIVMLGETQEAAPTP